MKGTRGSADEMRSSPGLVVCRSPIDGMVIREYGQHDSGQIEGVLGAADEAFRAWGSVVPAGRRLLMERMAVCLESEAGELAELMAREMGKPLAAGRAEVAKCAWVCRYYAEQAERQLADRPVEAGEGRAWVVFRPIGIVLAVMPWNFPFWQVFRCAVPAVMAGNAVVVKHASNVPGCAERIEGLFRSAGFPEGLVGNLMVSSGAVAGVIGDPRVRAVSLTGSTPAGRAVAAEAGRHLKKVVLELGGSDPYVVLGDADVASAARIGARARLVNSGQSCIAAKRFIVVDAVREAFEAGLVRAMSEVRMGDPLAEGTDMGPMARHDLRDEVHRQVRGSVAAGARLLLGGEVPSEGILAGGAYYPPTVLAGVRPGMPAWDEEIFGPVAVVIGAEDREEAVRIANGSPFGLGAAVFTTDPDAGFVIARDELEAGTCVVNTFVQSDPRLPFGGVKDSGHGRELADFGILEFVNIKTVVVCDRPTA